MSVIIPVSGVQLRQAATVLQTGGIVAYPTEAVYGLGCDPRNHAAVRKILTIKGRPTSKGLLLIAADYRQVLPFVGPISDVVWGRCLATWPGPVTWVLPARAGLSDWLRGDHDTVAVRVTAHPIAAALCRAVGYPLVSTSANRTGHSPLRAALSVRRVLGREIDCLIHGAVGNLTRPTPIFDARTGAVVRSG